MDLMQKKCFVETATGLSTLLDALVKTKTLVSWPASCMG